MSSEQRQKIQHEEIRAWLDQQMEEKENAEKSRKLAEQAYEEAVIARDQRALELDKMEKHCRQKLYEACLRFNKALVGTSSYIIRMLPQSRYILDNFIYLPGPVKAQRVPRVSYIPFWSFLLLRHFAFWVRFINYKSVLVCLANFRYRKSCDNCPSTTYKNVEVVKKIGMENCQITIREYWLAHAIQIFGSFNHKICAREICS